jgi:hypothetical protein
VRVTTDQPVFNLHGLIVLPVVLAVLMCQSPTYADDAAPPAEVNPVALCP